jgi:hypothetical protein
VTPRSRAVSPILNHCFTDCAARTAKPYKTLSDGAGSRDGDFDSTGGTGRTVGRHFARPITLPRGAFGAAARLRPLLDASSFKGE